jgi:peptidoglycan/LPS O-acetylase OafA/YrhL
MSITANNSLSSRDRLFKIAIIVWIAILFLVGTNLRVRSGTQAPEIDWLVLVQISVCLIGGFIGVLLIRQNENIGWGAKTLLIYLLVAGISAFFSPDMKTVFGYWFLLSGASLLTLGIVQTVQNRMIYAK